MLASRTNVVGRPARTFGRAAVEIRTRAEHRFAVQGRCGVRHACPHVFSGRQVIIEYLDVGLGKGAYAVFVQLEHSSLCWKVGKQGGGQSLCDENSSRFYFSGFSRWVFGHI